MSLPCFQDTGWHLDKSSILQCGKLILWDKQLLLEVLAITIKNFHCARYSECNDDLYTLSIGTLLHISLLESWAKVAAASAIDSCREPPSPELP